MRHVVVLVGLIAVSGCGGGGGETDAVEDRPDVVDDSADRADDDAGEDAAEVAEDVGEEADEAGPVCGNGVVDPGEDCDLLNLDGATCVSLGHPAGGTMKCDSTCHFDESWCRNPICGDGTCALGETATGCAADCHDGCGNGACEDAEDQFGCPADCGAVGVSAGGDQTCAVLADGTIRCWGLLPAVVPGVSNAVAVSTGNDHACARLSDGTARCWGRNEYGQLGDGTTDDSDISVVVSRLSGAVSVSAGSSRTCAALLDDTVTCWGGGYSTLPVVAEGISGAVAVSVGLGVTWALLRDGSVTCLGCAVAPSLPPTLAVSPGYSGWAGDDHVCAVQLDGTASCWGRNEYGQLGDGTSTGTEIPVLVSDLGSVVAVSATEGSSCAVLSNGTARCWGRNDGGQLGDGTGTGSFVPVPVLGLAGGIAVSSGTASIVCSGIPTPPCLPYSHTCAVLADGTAWCWGSVLSGGLGDGTTTSSNVPVQVAAW